MRQGNADHLFWFYYTEGQRSVLCIVAGEVKRHGICDLPIDKIGAFAGVCRTTVQTTLHEARLLFHITITERPQPGRKHLTNVVEIVWREWREWLKRAPSAASRIGSNLLNLASTTKIISNDEKGDAANHGKAHDQCEADKWVAELARIAGHSPDQLPEPWRLKGGHVVREWLDQLDKARIPHEWLRNVSVHVMKRKPDPELPWSIRSFEPEVKRLIKQVERDRALLLPSAGVSAKQVFVFEGTSAYEAWCQEKVGRVDSHGISSRRKWSADRRGEVGISPVYFRLTATARRGGMMWGCHRREEVPRVLPTGGPMRGRATARSRQSEPTLEA